MPTAAIPSAVDARTAPGQNPPPLQMKVGRPDSGMTGSGGTTSTPSDAVVPSPSAQNNAAASAAATPLQPTGTTSPADHAAAPPTANAPALLPTPLANGSALPATIPTTATAPLANGNATAAAVAQEQQQQQQQPNPALAASAPAPAPAVPLVPVPNLANGNAPPRLPLSTPRHLPLHPQQAGLKAETSNGPDSNGTVADAKREMARKVSCQDIQLVQNMIERCMQLYMSQKEVVHALHTQAHVDPTFTMLVWQKLELSNPAFFHTYYTWLRIKDQVVAYNYLVDQHNSLAHKGVMGGPANVAGMPPPTGWMGPPPPPGMPTSAGYGAFPPPPPPGDAGWGSAPGRSESLPPWLEAGGSGNDQDGKGKDKSPFGHLAKGGSTNSLDHVAWDSSGAIPMVGLDGIHALNTPGAISGRPSVGGMASAALGLGAIPRNLSISDLSLDICREFTDDAAMLNIFPALDEMGGGGARGGGVDGTAGGGSGANRKAPIAESDGGKEDAEAPLGMQGLEHIGKNFSFSEFNRFEGAIGDGAAVTEP